MALEIRTTPAILNYHNVKPQHSIKQPKARVEGSITHSKISVEATLPKVTIDQTECFNESGLKTVSAFRADNVAYAKQKMQESVGRIASQGDELTNVHLGGNPIADQAYSNAYDQFEHEFGMVTMPRSRPKIDVIEGRVDIKVQEGENTKRVIAQKPEIDYKQGKVEKYMKQYGSISIRYLGENVNLSV